MSVVSQAAGNLLTTPLVQVDSPVQEEECGEVCQQSYDHSVCVCLIELRACSLLYIHFNLHKCTRIRIRIKKLKLN